MIKENFEIGDKVEHQNIRFGNAVKSGFNLGIGTIVRFTPTKAIIYVKFENLKEKKDFLDRGLLPSRHKLKSGIGVYPENLRKVKKPVRLTLEELLGD